MVSAYYKKWYAENKDHRNRKRRLRYHNDFVYREQQKAMSRKCFESQKKGKVSKPKEYRLINVITKDGGESKQLRVYTVGYLASFIDRTMQTIKNWENKGILPVSPIRVNKWRLYTFKMIQDVVSALKRRNGIVSEEYKGKGFMDEISLKWENALNKYDPESLVQDY